MSNASDDLPLPEDIPLIGKYSNCVHPALAKKQFIDDFIDIDEMQKELFVAAGDKPYKK